VAFLRARGFAAERVPLSGSCGGRYSGDVSIPLLNKDRTVEVKVRANGFRELYRWLVDRDLLVIRADRHDPLVVVPLRLAADIAAAAEQKKSFCREAKMPAPGGAGTSPPTLVGRN
jgi:hypothetical protein